MIPSPPALTSELRSRFLDLVDRQFGIRGSNYGASRLDEAVSRVLPSTDYASAGELLQSFKPAEHARWLYELVEHLTVGETYFLRDPAQIAALRETILPDVLARCSDERRLRIWSAGCSTGEEPYTLAMLLTEQGVDPEWDLQLIGTDVNRDSLRIARAGHYAAWSFRATPDETRARYFEPVDQGWRVIEPIRRMARFAWMNLGAEALLQPTTELDLIVCRNVTIYFDNEASQRLYRALVRALAPGGWLMLGPSDPMPAQREGLERVEVNDTVLWRRATAVRHARPKPVHKAARPATSTLERQPVTPLEPLPDNGLLATIVRAPTAGHGDADLEAGLLALESGSSDTAVEWLRRAAFRDPASAVCQFALARGYLDLGDVSHARATLLHTRRLLAPLLAEDVVPGTDELGVDTLRQTIQSYLESLIYDRTAVGFRG
jgi:chemotaxis protein methyltransferase CheR